MDKLSLQAQKKIVKKLRKLIPETKCSDGCYECCKGISFVRGLEISKWEEQQLLRAQVTPVVPKDNSMDIECPYLENGRCKIYDMRPIICRMYGSIKMFANDSFCKSVPFKTLTMKEIREVGNLYFKVYEIKKSKLEF